ncbi:mannosyltransferase complex subunit MNN9 [Aspergillus novofumigatus IBT 16806]|uniref:Anp1-domain-containing protein n=1 Tax=Aspergillus novofumigatus (strain IBT 16806) TaxID=1392255 RepID=A0A2I1CKB3_ASPN1|nr:Anp1-domain-containing protein [Aspergillus novofumigatus IBT 16806]PKX98038.1 Anp1-domain-containing protein [Aspergillus novofumigatus IBT 16806]
MSSVEALLSPVDAKVPGDMGSRSQSTPAVVPGATVSTEKKSDYKGFVAGVFSGIAKLSVGHPFDTVKVRLQTSKEGHFKGPLDCVLQTVRKEGVSGLYKGATPPLVGWMVMDSVMLGSLTLYRRLLLENVFSKPAIRSLTPFASYQADPKTLPSFGHGIAGILAGTTVSFVAAPVEHIKARLQIQYAADKSKRMYSGPIDCLKKLLRTHGIAGLYRGLCATILFRSNVGASNQFLGRGMSAQIFWLTSYPSDVVKQRLMTDPMGGALGDGERKFRRWKDAARAVYHERGWRGYWRGFVPCFLRAFPANAMALVAFEGVMRSLPCGFRDRLFDHSREIELRFCKVGPRILFRPQRSEVRAADTGQTIASSSHHRQLTSLVDFPCTITSKFTYSPSIPLCRGAGRELTSLLAKHYLPVPTSPPVQIFRLVLIEHLQFPRASSCPRHQLQPYRFLLPLARYHRSTRPEMAVARTMRRTNPITLLLAAILAAGSGSSSSSSSSQQRREDDAAENPLSPPTKPFFKSQPVRHDGQQAPPPVVQYDLNQLTSTSTSAANGERILILTPMARFVPEYWDNVVKLTYPHELISIGFIIPKNKEGNAALAALEAAIAKTQSGPIDKRFASISILRQDFEPPLQSQDEKERHKMSNQKARRESMSRARNSLLFTTLGPATAWVLWLDADIVETPPTLIQDLTAHDYPVLVPNCYQRYYNSEKKKMDVRPYDYNSWIDSSTAQSMAAEMGPDEILLEGYAEMPTYRTLMAYLADTANPNPKKVIELDGVGGTALMVKAEVHRDGAMFPAFPFYHLVETEGFAKMAKRLGYSIYGLPDYFVYHQNE